MDFEDSRSIFDAVRKEVELIGPTELRVTKSQIAFIRRKTVLLVWIPRRYLHRKTAPLALTFLFTEPDPSPRWKQIVEPAPGNFTHHLELFSVVDVNDELKGLLRKAYLRAGSGEPGNR